LDFGNIGGTIVHFIILQFIFFGLELIKGVFLVTAGHRTHDPLTEIISPLYGWFSFSMKRVKLIGMREEIYTHLSRDGSVSVYRQHPLCLELIGKFNFDGDVNVLGEKIKRKLEELYGIEERRNSERERENEKRASYKKWSGALDKQTNRKEKLKKII